MSGLRGVVGLGMTGIKGGFVVTPPLGTIALEKKLLDWRRESRGDGCVGFYCGSKPECPREWAKHMNEWGRAFAGGVHARLDSANLPRLDLLKIDIPRGELIFFGSAKQMIQAHSPYIVVANSSLSDLPQLFLISGYNSVRMGNSVIAAAIGDPNWTRIAEM